MFDLMHGIIMDTEGDKCKDVFPPTSEDASPITFADLYVSRKESPAASQSGTQLSRRESMINDRIYPLM